MSNLNPRIYVACLAAYNNGYLHGEWIDASQDEEALFLEVQKILLASPMFGAEEFAIHDYEGFGDISINEYTELKTISEIANFVEEYDELGAAVLGYVDGDIDQARKLLEEYYHGEHDSEEEFAYYWIHEVDCREIPEFLQYYIDYKAMARDFFINDFFSLEVSNKVHVLARI